MFPLRSGRLVMRRRERPSPFAAHEIPMRTYLITYDLASPARHSLSGAIMQLGDAWARPLDTTWYVQSTERAEALERRLKPHLDGEDGLLIQQVESRRPPAQHRAQMVPQAAPGQRRGSRQCALRSPCLRCLKPRRPDPLPLWRRFRKLEMSRKPSVWRFSAWNPVPAMLSIPPSHAP